MIGLGHKTYHEIDCSVPNPHLVAAGASHIGKRPQQQDAIYSCGHILLPHNYETESAGNGIVSFVESCHFPGVFAIADGMGGHAYGDIASSLCIENLDKACRNLPRYSSVESVAAFVSMGIAEADKAIVEQACSNGGADMGTTLVALSVCDDGCRISSIGDSRCYLYANNELVCLTKDDTEAQRIADMGLAPGEEYTPLYSGDSLTRYVGQGRNGLVVKPREYSFDVDSALIMLCSDGLYKALRDDEIANVLSAGNSLAQTSTELVEQSISRDDADNSSVLLVQVRRS